MWCCTAASLATPFKATGTVGVYVDERAGQERAQALGNIFSGQAGGWPAVLGSLIESTLARRQVPIRFETVVALGQTAACCSVPADCVA
jgi:hypothetical protein